MTADDARHILGKAAMIGLTVKNDIDADTAIAAPIDYACIGGVFTTLSKNNPDAPVGLAGLSRLRNMMRAARPALPVGAIAGITLANAPQVIAAGADGVATISSLFKTDSSLLGAGDAAASVRTMRATIDKALGERS